MCRGDQRQMYHVLSQRRGTVHSCTVALRQHVVVVCWSCCTDVGQETAVTSPAVDVTSVTASGSRTTHQSLATSRTTDHLLIHARYSSTRRCTAVDHHGRLRCHVDISFRRRWWRWVDSVSHCCTDGLLRTHDRQHTWCYQCELLHAHLQHTAINNIKLCVVYEITKNDKSFHPKLDPE